MSKYVEGFYKSKASEQEFNELILLKHRIQMVAGMDQNDMIITEEDIEYCSRLVKEVILKLNSWFENKVDSLVYIGKELSEEEKNV